tara:strand:+ start:142 stop:1047 length:906 start_codon:yes stop_codon:yes gene_type:complete
MSASKQAIDRLCKTLKGASEGLQKTCSLDFNEAFQKSPDEIGDIIAALKKVLVAQKQHEKLIIKSAEYTEEDRARFNTKTATYTEAKQKTPTKKGGCTCEEAGPTLKLSQDKYGRNLATFTNQPPAKLSAWLKGVTIVSEEEGSKLDKEAEEETMRVRNEEWAKKHRKVSTKKKPANTRALTEDEEYELNQQINAEAREKHNTPTPPAYSEEKGVSNCKRFNDAKREYSEAQKNGVEHTMVDPTTDQQLIPSALDMDAYTKHRRAKKTRQKKREREAEKKQEGYDTYIAENPADNKGLTVG